jgi:hypothetical protein
VSSIVAAIDFAKLPFAVRSVRHACLVYAFLVTLPDLGRCSLRLRRKLKSGDYIVR